MPTKEEILSALFPRTVGATYAGSGLARRSLAGTLDAASLPGRAYSALWHRYDEPMLQNMARTTATPGSSLAASVAEGMARDPLTLLSAPVGGLAGSGGRALASGVGSALMRRAAPVAADAAANAGLSALAQYGTEGRVDPGALAANAGLGLGMQGLGSAVAKMAPKGRAAIMENPNFRKWFEGSKVVDDAGNPLTVYHGTNKDFNTFRYYEDYGHHFGDISAANERNKYTGGNNLISAHVKMEKPFSFAFDPGDWSIESTIDAGGEQLEELMLSQLKREGKFAFSDATVPPSEWEAYSSVRDYIDDAPYRNEDLSKKDIHDLVARSLKSSGYDGIKYPNAIEGGVSYVVRDPTQIKSATGNRGTFDPNDPNITHFAGGQSPIAGANALAGRYFRGLMNRDEKKEKR